MALKAKEVFLNRRDKHYTLFTEFFPQIDGIIQHLNLFIKFFPQTDLIFPTNRRDFSHKPTQIFKRKSA